MSQALDTIRRWLQILADSNYDAWDGIAAEELVIRTPFAPPGMPRISTGREVCRGMAREYGRLIKRFAYLDVELHTTDDPELIMGTARSEGLTASGRIYANQYCILARVRGGKLIEYVEYFDPQVVVAAAAAEHSGAKE